MTNKALANVFQYLGNLMELHGENKFKIRSYNNAYITLRKLPESIMEMETKAMEGIKGIGKSTAAKIDELRSTGQMAALKKYEDITPEGVREMLKIKGFGPKKIGVIWKEMGVETIGELLYACNENRLIELKGFGAKTQADLKQKLEYYERSKDKFRFAEVMEAGRELVKSIQKKLPLAKVELTGEMRRKCNEINRIEILVGSDDSIEALFTDNFLSKTGEKDQIYDARSVDNLPVKLYHCPIKAFGSKQFRYTAAHEFINSFVKKFEGVDFTDLTTEAAVFEKVKLPFIAPELRESDWALDLAINGKLPELITQKDIKGVVHNHSTYSDGIHTLEEMADACKSAGYEYLVMSDHSKSAFYANGLKEDRLRRQWAEIDTLNKKMSPFKIFKSIESDILNDGNLDYPDEILIGFDLVIASVHSNLRMDETKATQRILTAIRHPYTTILGHPTGRLLLSRKGYPIDHKVIIDACAEHGVAIELNANPYRLDIDWTWIPYCMEKGVLVSINPDAHSTSGIKDIEFGIYSARKGGLTKAACLNTMSLTEFEGYLEKQDSC